MTDALEDIPIRDDLQTVAFYNLENLFDTTEDKHTHDNDFLPTSVKKWTPKRYKNKLKKLGFAISNIGRHETGKYPAIVGLAEVENASVIEDLINSEHLEDCNYDYVHYDSLDERGIDVALLYDANAFEVTGSETFTIQLFDDDGSPDYTRDILLVSGLLDGEAIHVIVNHWSSRREGEKETEHKRMASSDKAAEVISMLRDDNPDAKIIVIGDFNDDPSSKSIKQLVEGSNLYNPMEVLRSYNRGTTNHNRRWNLFDQILFSTNFFKSTTDKFKFSTANIFDEDFLKLFNGRYKGTPFRTFVGKRYKGGYSDHFPVYAIFKK
ncbi:endonuclease/exonuclease/phosphatase family protein [Flavivirga abyssicola]|uniref:endonuclease/exonuclease/phosphatase family protein n=1 Tax=Flavivirga abyssicola TaxID=3063533 RepID=UPI0026DF49D8|nr:endonuclease/exonuclease/phosphatase family protein [Flavivirga sp. MEBiC07777]WVK14547.1 endonuclease/exonuclease/phosphatase family protein [Flavivirga sp. MEBiC07777]